MGGQIAAAGGLHLDMRGFNRIVSFSPEEKRITVQAGARWRDVQEQIDAAGLSVAIMQSYANFTVGGSVSVNAHGRYVGVGPIIQSIESLQIVLADGSVLRASRHEHSEIFFGTIGGYGWLGVITEVTLNLVDNIPLKRASRVMPVAAYPSYFETMVRRGEDVVLHNADIYPDAYTSLRAVNFTRTGAPVTVTTRLRPRDESSPQSRFAYWAITALPFGKGLRRWLVDPLQFRGDHVVWRNYESSYDASALEPASRAESTYALQEYFVPVDRFTGFVERLAGIVRKHHANVVNVSVRHAAADTESLLAWARGEVFAFVVYYKQGTSPQERASADVWSRELVDAALSEGGRYYLPYQLHATADQFNRAYPAFPEFLALKRRLDPSNKFTNAMWMKYAPAPAATTASF